jgi:hypothetical protein
MKKKTILLAVLLVFITSCSKQEDAANVNVINTPEVEVQVSTTPTTVPEITSTVPYIPKKAEDFENCESLPKFENGGYYGNYDYYYDYYGYNTQGDTITHSYVTHDDSSWKINKDGAAAEITNPQIIDGLVYFSINGVKITMTEGAILYIELYKDPPSYDTAYQLMYSPTTNNFLMYSPTVDVDQLNQGLIHLDPYPIIVISIYPDSTVSLTNKGGITSNYQGSYCVERNNGHIAHEELKDKQCVIYTLPNGDEYGYGVNKYGEVVCPQLWIEETETE